MVKNEFIVIGIWSIVCEIFLIVLELEELVKKLFERDFLEV